MWPLKRRESPSVTLTVLQGFFHKSSGAAAEDVLSPDVLPDPTGCQSTGSVLQDVLTTLGDEDDVAPLNTGLTAAWRREPHQIWLMENSRNGYAPARVCPR